MKKGYPVTPLQELFNDLLAKKEVKQKAVEEACIYYGKLVGSVVWFGTQVRCVEVDGMHEVRNDKGYVICTFSDQKPARRFAELINLVGGGE